MPVIQLPLIPGTLPPDACYPNEQARLNAFMQASYAALSGQTFFNYGADEPAPEFRTFPWLNTTDGRWYSYLGAWIQPYNYDFNERRLYVGDLTALQTYDGGDTGAPGTMSGPTWVEDTEFIGRSPMGPGAIPTSNPAVTLNVATNAGEGAHAQTSEELYPHSHEPNDDFSGFLGLVKPGKPSNFEITGGTEVRSMGTTALEGGNADGDAEPANVIHPVRGAYIIKWTGRLYRRAV